MSKHPAVTAITGGLRPRFRGHVHTWAFAVAVPAVAVLLFVAAHDRWARLGAGVFGFSLLAVYGVSAAYHRLARSPRAQGIMRRADHSMIFVLIAGTYTPICLLALPPPWPVPMLVAVWALAAVGIATKVWGTDWIMKAANSLYLLIGWLAILALPAMIRTMAPTVLAFLVLGGILYTVGAVLFYLRRPDPRPEIFGYHEVWHTFTVLAGASHFAMVALVVR